MTKQERLTAWLAKNIVWPRMTSEFHAAIFYNRFEDFSEVPQCRTSAQEIAEEVLGIAEFRALQLGTWLGTEDGQMIAQAVEAVSPPFYRQDEELLVEALMMAAAMQQSEGKGKAGKVALGAIGVFTFVAIGLAGAVPGRAA